MGRKKFIDKKTSATYRLVFKESSSAAGGGFEDGADRVFVRVDGGDAHVPGFDPDTEEDEEVEQGEEQEEKNQGRGRAPVSEHSRREIIELGFPDDGYNYLQHLREVGPSGRIGSFVPISRVRLDPLRPDVKAYDASKVQVLSSAEENDSNALIVSGSARSIRGPASKVVDSDVVALLDREDDDSLVSGDELEDDFVAIANEGVKKHLLEETGSVQGDEEPLNSESEHFVEVEDFKDNDDQYERPARFLDEQFELLALREYDDDEIGELDDDDFSARGPAHISKFDNVMADFLINSTSVKDKYQTPAEINSSFTRDGKQEGHSELLQSVKKAEESCSTALSSVEKNNIRALAMLDESVSSEEEMALVVGSDSDEDEHQWDCETVVTTYSNLDNHPGKICAFPRGSAQKLIEDSKSVIRIRGKQQLPVDYLPKRNNLHGDEKNKTSNLKRNTVDAEGTKVRRADETKEEKKARKAAVKEEKRAARVSKKDTTVMYKDESQRAQRTAAFTGPATVHL